MAANPPIPGPESSPAPAREEGRQAYFTVGALKFCLMSLTTFGLYELYWFYRNWRVIREREQSQISPFWRAFFNPIWTFSMGARFAGDARARNISLALPAVALGILYLLLHALWRLPDPYWLVTLLAFVPLLPFDFAARRLNGNGELSAPTFARFSVWNITWIVVGSLLLALTLLGTFLPAPEA
jgi:hypothetical protein